MASRKIFVGSLPHNIEEALLREEFGKHGKVESVFVKQGCEPGRQWAFVTFADSTQAQCAKDLCDRKLMFPGHDRPVDVTIAKNQGMFGQEPIAPKPVDPMAAVLAQQSMMLGQAGVANSVQPRKIFVGSLPDSITEEILRAEFVKYGPITDFFLKTGCEPGRQWAFITYQTFEQANFAKSSADRVLVLPGADKACEVMIAKSKEAPVASAGVAAAQVFAQNPMLAAFGAQMPCMGGMSFPPMALPQWQTYYTTAGVAYYHNAGTGVTQWDCPPELQMQQQQLGMQQQQFGMPATGVPAAQPAYGQVWPGMAPAAGIAPAYGQPLAIDTSAYAVPPAAMAPAAYGAAAPAPAGYGAATAPAAYGAAAPGPAAMAPMAYGAASQPIGYGVAAAPGPAYGAAAPAYGAAVPAYGAAAPAMAPAAYGAAAPVLLDPARAAPY